MHCPFTQNTSVAEESTNEGGGTCLIVDYIAIYSVRGGAIRDWNRAPCADFCVWHPFQVNESTLRLIYTVMVCPECVTGPGLGRPRLRCADCTAAPIAVPEKNAKDECSKSRSSRGNGCGSKVLACARL